MSSGAGQSRGLSRIEPRIGEVATLLRETTLEIEAVLG
jgi:hypothetical protein